MPGEHPFEIEAGSMEYEFRRKLYVARAGDDGRVVIRQKGRRLHADWVAYSRITRRGVASGNVVITEGPDELRTAFVEFDIDTLEGVMFDAELVAESTPMELKGAEVAKTGERTYAFRDGRFTTCRCPDPDAREPWEITAESAELEVEGYGTARNSTVEVLGVPVLWLPWMIYPLKTERQSGILFPEFSYTGRNGFEVGLPIFFAAGDPVNVTLTPRWLSERGAKGDLEVEYVLGERSAGTFFGSGLYDDDVRANSLRTPFEKGRWAALGDHDLYLPGGVRVASEYAFASDNAYPNDFDELEDRRRDRFLTAEAFVEGQVGAAGMLGASAGAVHRDDLQNPDDTDRDRFLLQRLPSVQVESLPTPLPLAEFIVPSLDVRYDWFHQRDRPDRVFSGLDPGLVVSGNGRFIDTGIDGLPTSVTGGGGPVGIEQGSDGLGIATNADPSFDDFGAGNPSGTEGDGIFQEGELIADQGHRVLINPRIGVPLRLFDALELYSEAGWHETLYQSRGQGGERRGFVTGRAEASLRFKGDVFGALHLFEPRVGWAFADTPQQVDSPLFTPRTAVEQRRLRDLSFSNLTRDWADRVRDYHAVKIGFGNRFYRRGEGDGTPATLLADFVVQALYDIERDRFGTLFLDGRAYPFDGAWTRFNFGLDTDAAQVDEALFEIGWADDRGDVLRLGYRYLRDVPEVFERFPEVNRRFGQFVGVFDRVSHIEGGVRLVLTRGWAVGYRFVYSLERTLLVTNRGYIEYTSACDCWGLAIELGGTRGRGIGVNVRYQLLGLGDDRRNRRGGPGAFQRTSLDAFGGV